MEASLQHHVASNQSGEAKRQGIGREYCKNCLPAHLCPLRGQRCLHINEMNAAIAVQPEIHNQKLFQLEEHSPVQLYTNQEKICYSCCRQTFFYNAPSAD
jgi:hypothetical protein